MIKENKGEKDKKEKKNKIIIMKNLIKKNVFIIHYNF